MIELLSIGSLISSNAIVLGVAKVGNFIYSITRRKTSETLEFLDVTSFLN